MEKTRDWIAGNSDKKFLITDEWTVAGYEFDTVILVAYDHQMRDVSSVCQRARAKLIVYQIDKVAAEDFSALKKFKDISLQIGKTTTGVKHNPLPPEMLKILMNSNMYFYSITAVS